MLDKLVPNLEITNSNLFMNWKNWFQNWKLRIPIYSRIGIISSKIGNYEFQFNIFRILTFSQYLEFSDSMITIYSEIFTFRFLQSPQSMHVIKSLERTILSIVSRTHLFRLYIPEIFDFNRVYFDRSWNRKYFLRYVSFFFNEILQPYNFGIQSKLYCTMVLWCIFFKYAQTAAAINMYTLYMLTPSPAWVYLNHQDAENHNF